MNSRPRVVIIGGGIAGISCLETLLQDHNANNAKYRMITMVSESRIVKKAVNYQKKGINLDSFDIGTCDALDLEQAAQSIGIDFHFVQGKVTSIEATKCVAHVRDDSAGQSMIDYDILCLCHGSSPKHLPLSDMSPEVLNRILVIRDTTSIRELSLQLLNTKKVAVIGNGGIGLEMVNKLDGCDIIWLVRDDYIGLPFLDSGASKFLLNKLNMRHKTSGPHCVSERNHYSTDTTSATPSSGPALGPHWLQDLTLKGQSSEGSNIEIAFRSEVEHISYEKSSLNPLVISTKNKKSFSCDLIIVAIGVHPNQLNFVDDSPDVSSTDGGILIDSEMRTSMKSIYAAGDVVSCDRWPKSELWFQMRLWTQARQMGTYCAKCIAAHLNGENPSIFANFDCFTHITSFFGHKLVLLGRYIEIHLQDRDLCKLDVLVRVDSQKDYVKLVLEDDRVIGAILIGETALEETIENLIYDRINICDIKDQLLEDTIDIEDYFD